MGLMPMTMRVAMPSLMVTRSHARAHSGQTERTVSSVLVSTSSTDRNFLLIEKKEKLNGYHYSIDSIYCTCSSSPALGSQQH